MAKKPTENDAGEGIESEAVAVAGMDAERWGQFVRLRACVIAEAAGRVAGKFLPQLVIADADEYAKYVMSGKVPSGAKPQG